MFQSAPADCRREKGRGHRFLTTVYRFNPLPPTVGGRSAPTGYWYNAQSVSIRSRRLSAGEAEDLRLEG